MYVFHIEIIQNDRSWKEEEAQFMMACSTGCQESNSQPHHSCIYVQRDIYGTSMDTPIRKQPSPHRWKPQIPQVTSVWNRLHMGADIGTLRVGLDASLPHAPKVPLYEYVATTSECLNSSDGRLPHFFLLNMIIGQNCKLIGFLIIAAKV